MTLEELEAAGARKARPSELSEDQLLALGGKTKRRSEDEDIGPVEAFARKASSAVSSNFVNPISAKISSAISGQPYGDALRGINESDEVAEKNNPRAALAGTVAGAGLQIAAPLPGLAAGAGHGARVAHAAGVGAGLGALGGAGDALAEGGSAGDAAAAAGRGAAIGGAGGAVLGHVVGKLFRGAPERVDERLIRDISRGEAGGKGAKKLTDRVAALTEKPGAVAADTGGVPTAVLDGAETVAVSKPNFTPNARPRDVSPETGYVRLGEGPGVTVTSENATKRVAVAPPIKPVAEAPTEGIGSNQVLEALDGEGVKTAIAKHAGNNPAKAAQVIQDALERNNNKTLKPIYAAIDSGPAVPQALELKLHLQDVADRLRAGGEAAGAAHVEQYGKFVDHAYQDGKPLTATMLRKLRNDVGAGNAFPSDEIARSAPGVRAKQEIYAAINGTIEDAAAKTPGVDVATLRAGNKRAATLAPIAQVLADRAAKHKGGASTLTHAVAGAVGLAEIAHIAAQGMSTGNVAKAAMEIASIYAARHVAPMIPRAAKALDYKIAEVERAARAGGATPQMIRAIGEAVAARSSAAAARARISNPDPPSGGE